MDKVASRIRLQLVVHVRGVVVVGYTVLVIQRLGVDFVHGEHGFPEKPRLDVLIHELAFALVYLVDVSQVLCGAEAQVQVVESNVVLVGAAQFVDLLGNVVAHAPRRGFAIDGAQGVDALLVPLPEGLAVGDSLVKYAQQTVVDCRDILGVAAFCVCGKKKA